MALSPIEGMLYELAGNLLSNPSTWSQIGSMLGELNALGCHTAADVGIDALDAYKAGHMSRDQALRIVCIALEDGKAAQARRDREDLVRAAQLIPSPPELEAIRAQIRNMTK